MKCHMTVPIQLMNRNDLRRILGVDPSTALPRAPSRTLHFTQHERRVVALLVGHVAMLPLSDALAHQ